MFLVAIFSNWLFLAIFVVVNVRALRRFGAERRSEANKNIALSVFAHEKMTGARVPALLRRLPCRSACSDRVQRRFSGGQVAAHGGN